MLVDALARVESITMDRLQENAAVGRGRCSGKKVLLAKPMTFMNNSGESVGRLARFYRVRTVHNWLVPLNHSGVLAGRVSFAS